MTIAFQQRRRWRNHTGNQSIEPLRIYRPASLEDVQEIVRSAERDGATVRAVGSGHSWSDVALTTGYLLRPERLSRPLEITGNLVRVEAGMRLRELNRERGVTLVVVTHDPGVAERADRIVRMSDGRIVADERA